MWSQPKENHGWESSDVVRFDLGPLLQDQTRVAKLKSAYNSLTPAPRGLGCETNLQEIMDWESSDMVRFGLGPILQGQMRVAKQLIITCTLGTFDCTVPSVLAQLLTGFGELSFWWIQFALGLVNLILYILDLSHVWIHGRCNIKQNISMF